MIAARAAVVVALFASAPAQGGWLDVDYSRLVDRRQPSHSGEPVGVLLERLGGRALEEREDDSGVRTAHALLDPLVEPYAFVLPDALDAIGASGGPWIEIAGLWSEGERQPAWVELLRARRFVVESDGRGNMRIFVPDVGDSAAAAWHRSWSLMRHVLAAERRRLGGEAPIDVAAYRYRHEPERGAFRLDPEPHVVKVTDTRPDGRQPPLDLERLAGFLRAGLRLEGARLDKGGSLRLFGSRDDPGGLLGRPVALSDLAVAYRAVARGGLAEPYMSLDRGPSPQAAIVNYGGRLRDTALGWISLLCDIRFKTFSLGLDVGSGADRRADVRQAVPDFRTHLERFADHPDSLTVAAQQTRLWFYPDDVDLTLSDEGDVLVLRTVRMSAASERVQETGIATGRESPDPPWTRETVSAINERYDELSGMFPELAELDVVVRLLSLFTWLRQAETDGHLVPELDSLLALELPALPTPRTFPQMLAFNALPAPRAGSPVEVYDRVEVGAALDRLDPASGVALPARVRFERARTALDPAVPEQAALLAELAAVDPAATDPGRLDLSTFRAERLRMHRLVLATLGGEPRDRVAGRLEDGEALRVFSVGIGGIDLGMGRVLERARERRSGDADARASPRGSAAPRDAWRRDPVGLETARLPDHGAAADPSVRVTQLEDGGRQVRVLLGADAPDVRGRDARFDRDGLAVAFVRTEGARRLAYGFERDGERLVARPIELGQPGVEPAPAAGAAPPAGLGVLTVQAGDGTGEVAVRLEVAPNGVSRKLEAGLDRGLLQRAALGPEVDLYGGRPLDGLAPLPAALEDVESVMLLGTPSRWEPPWSSRRRIVAGDEDPARVGRGLSRWWSVVGGPAAVVGLERDASMLRWAAAPRPSDARLWLPRDAFADGALRDALAAAWGMEGVVERAEDAPSNALVVLVSAEPPGTLSRRLRETASGPLRGRMLAVWSLAGPLRADLPARLVGSGGLSGLGVGDPAYASRRRAEQVVAALSRSFAGERAVRVERRPGPLLWFF